MAQVSYHDGRQTSNLVRGLYHFCFSLAGSPLLIVRYMAEIQVCLCENLNINSLFAIVLGFAQAEELVPAAMSKLRLCSAICIVYNVLPPLRTRLFSSLRTVHDLITSRITA